MSTYRLFPATNGPAAGTAYTGPFIAGVIFSIDGDNCWFDGYWWWVAASGQDTTPVKCALWTASSSGAGAGQSYVVPGSVVTSGTLTAGQWNYIPLPQPIQLSRGYSPNIPTAATSSYLAAVGWTSASGFPDTNGFWTTPINNGPLHAYQFSNGGGGAGSPPWTMPQGVFSTAGADPSVTMPGQASGTDNFWVDVQIDTVAPPGYTGTYRLYPNKGDANNDVSGDAAVNYTVGTEIHLTQPCLLNAVWYFSPNSAVSLATRADVWDISTGLAVASITSPSWKDHTGTAYTPTSNGAWIKAAFAAGTTLPAGSYRVSVYNSAGTSGSWSTKEASTDYWGQSLGGAGRNGMSWGPLTAPSWPNAAGGFDYNAAGGANSPPFSGAVEAHCQPVFAENGTVGFPQLYAAVGASLNQTQNYWVDLEVTPLTAPTPQPQPGSRTWRRLHRRAQQVMPAPPAAPGTTWSAAGAWTGTGTFGAAVTKSAPAAGAWTGTGVFTATVRKSAPGAGAWTGAGTLTSAAAKTAPAAGAWTGAGVFTATATVSGAAHSASAAWTGTGTLTATVAKQAPAATAWTGTGTLTPTAAKAAPAATAWTGTGTLGVTAAVAHPAATAWSGTGVFTAAVTHTGLHGTAAAWTGTGAFTAAPLKVAPAAGAWSGAGTLAATAQVFVPAAGAWTGTGTLAAGRLLAYRRAGAWSGTGVFSIAPQLEVPSARLGGLSAGQPHGRYAASGPHGRWAAGGPHA